MQIIQLKKSQLQIQEMAFMLVGVFLFFSLAALFAIIIFNQSLHSQATQIAETRTITAITNLADSPEFNCVSTKTNCIDGDKLISMVNRSVYQDFFPFSSLKIIRMEAFNKPEEDMIYCDFANYLSCSGIIKPVSNIFEVNPNANLAAESVNPDDLPISSGSTEMFSFKPTQGPFEHLSPNGKAAQPLIAYTDINPGELVTISEITGTIDYQGTSGKVDCKSTSGYGGAYGGFYDINENTKYAEYRLADFQKGIKAPSQSGIDKYRLIFYAKESNTYKGWYIDNTGECSFSLTRSEGNSENVNIEASESNTLDSGSLDPVLRCEPTCDYFLVYDKKVKNERAISSYVALCRKEYENGYTYERCEVAKIVAGTEVNK